LKAQVSYTASLNIINLLIVDVFSYFLGHDFCGRLFLYGVFTMNAFSCGCFTINDGRFSVDVFNADVILQNWYNAYSNQWHTLLTNIITGLFNGICTK